MLTILVMGGLGIRTGLSDCDEWDLLLLRKGEGLIAEGYAVGPF